MHTVELAYSDNLIWLLGIPVSIGIIYLVYKRVVYITETWFSPEQYGRSYPFLKMLARMIGFVMLFIGLVGPYWGSSSEAQRVMGREIYILLDVSASMNAEDLRPTRLEKVKKELKNLIANLKGDRIGLIVFSEYAYVQCPLTQDYRAISMFLDMANTDQFVQTGTHFRSALALAMDRFVNVEEGNKNQTRAVVLVSDGEDYGDTYVSLIERLRQFDIDVFTVGVGTYEGAPVPNMVENRKMGYKRYDDGALVISRLIDNDLEKIAKEFGSKYISLNDGSDNLSELETQIKSLTSSPLESNMDQVETNKYQIFLLLSVIALFGSLFVMPIRKI